MKWAMTKDLRCPGGRRRRDRGDSQAARHADRLKDVLRGFDTRNVADFRAAGFPADGPLSIEHEENPDDPIADLQHCVAIARAAVG